MEPYNLKTNSKIIKKLDWSDLNCYCFDIDTQIEKLQQIKAKIKKELKKRVEEIDWNIKGSHSHH